MEKEYKLKLGTARATVKLVGIVSTLDASDLKYSRTKQQLDNRDVGECILETTRPIAFDLASLSETTGRFVIVDNYEIAGGGIVLENLSGGESILERHIRERESHWETGVVLNSDRERANRHRSKFIVITGRPGIGKRALARELESMLFRNRCSTYYLGMAAIEHGLDADLRLHENNVEERLRRIGELARIMTDAGLIFITAVDDADDYDIEALKLLNAPNEILVVNVGRSDFHRTRPDLQLDAVEDIAETIGLVADLLMTKEIIVDYQI
jgi:bifunctional enzyme CysN/CysC